MAAACACGRIHHTGGEVLHLPESQPSERARRGSARSRPARSRAPRRVVSARRAAESYFGLWRQNQPNAHGLFRWYNGDMYFGEWALGKMQGYGVYHYGKAGVYAGDSCAPPARPPRVRLRGVRAGAGDALTRLDPLPPLVLIGHAASFTPY